MRKPVLIMLAALLLAPLLLACVPARAASAQEAASEPALDPRALRAIRTLHDSEAPAQDDLVARIEAFGALPVDELLRLLEHGRIDAHVGSGGDYDPLDGDVQQMNRHQERLLLTLLERAGSSVVDPAIERLLARSQAPGAVAAAILAAGSTWDASRLRDLFELALPLEDPARVDPRLERALEKGVARVLEGDPRAFETLSANWTHLPEPLLPAVIRAVGATRDGRGVELLGDVITRAPAQAGLVVAQLRRLGPSLDPDLNARLAAGLRERLDPLQATITRAALLALAELEDFESVPRMLELLETAPACQESALWALQRLAGRDWVDSPGSWRRWYESELEWHRSTWPQLSRELASPESGSRELESREPADATRSEQSILVLRAYARQRLYRHDLALEVGRFLELQTNRNVCLVAIDTLSQLGSRRGLPALVALLQRDDTELAAAALRALHVITGETHPADSPEWSSMLAP